MSNYGLGHVRGVEPERFDLSAPSIKRFLKLAHSHDLVVRVQSTITYVEPTYYASKTRAHNVGELKAEGYEMTCVFITATNLSDFAAHAVWYDGAFDFATVGSASLNSRAKTLTQITKTMEEITTCLS